MPSSSWRACILPRWHTLRHHNRHRPLCLDCYQPLSDFPCGPRSLTHGLGRWPEPTRWWLSLSQPEATIRRKSQCSPAAGGQRTDGRLPPWVERRLLVSLGVQRLQGLGGHNLMLGHC